MLHDTVFTFSVITAISTLFVTSPRNLKPSTNYFDAAACLRCNVTRSLSTPVFMRMVVTIVVHTALCQRLGTSSKPPELIYDMIYLTAIGLTPGGSSTLHIYTQTIHRTPQFTN